MSSTNPEIKPHAIIPPMAAGGNSIPEFDGKGNPSTALPPITPARKAWVENISILFRHKALILWVTAIVTIATGAYAFLFMPDYYKARAVILPARHEGGGLDNIASGISSSLKDIGLSKLGGGSEESYTPLSLMQSRELMAKMVKQFNYVSIYKAKNLPDAVDEFSKNLDGELTEEGNFIVSFTDTSAIRAAQVTNAVVTEINNVNTRLAQDEAKHNISASQARYEQNVADLDSAEAALGAFQQQYGVFALPQQAQAELTAMAQLEAEKYSAQIQLQNAEQLYGSNSSEVSVYKTAVDQLASKLGEMQAGQDMKASAFVPTNVMPDVALKYLRLMREVEIQSKLKAYILPEYEQAKLDEETNLYGFVTLDTASVPVRKAGPHRAIILLAAMMGTAVIMGIAVIMLTGFQKMRQNFSRDQQRIFS